MKHIAIYLRVSSAKQEHRSQKPDLEHWANGQTDTVRWYRDKASGKTMDRPAWNKLQKAISEKKVSQLVVWRLDRLGRTASGLTALFEELRRLKVNLVSLKDGLDLSTPAGRLMANVLASVAAYEIEVRGERVKAGQAVARAAGKKWGGRKPGTRIKLTAAKEDVIRDLKAKGTPITEIARTVEVSRPTVYAVLNQPES